MYKKADKDWDISESVLELGSGAAKYARRQITHAREEVSNDPRRSDTSSSTRFDAAPVSTLDKEIERIW